MLRCCNLTLAVSFWKTEDACSRTKKLFAKAKGQYKILHLGLGQLVNPPAQDEGGPHKVHFGAGQVGHLLGRMGNIPDSQLFKGQGQ